jgi:hypothetical protein
VSEAKSSELEADGWRRRSVFLFVHVGDDRVLEFRRLFRLISRQRIRSYDTDIGTAFQAAFQAVAHLAGLAYPARGVGQ